VHPRVAADLASGKHEGVVTRFPPEPNGYLHIGHAKSICLNFGIAAEFGGRCHLRFDDTNPAAEDVEYVDSIQEDIRWLGWDWGPHRYYASDYFQRLHEYAIDLIRAGKAYVCELSMQEFKAYRGVPTRPGRESPFRHRTVEENLDLFERMKAGEFEAGSHVLRARIDMNSPNLHLRDPAIYRVKKVKHHQTGDTWNIYPMYDFAHGLSDALEGITHSICTLEFEVHRPLYDWFLEQLDVPCRPQQIEFARLNLTYTVMSKRRLQELVREGLVSGWDDPRMPTIAGLRRRGYTPAAIRNFCDKIGVTKYDSMTDVALLEHCLRDDLNRTAPRRMAVLNPLKVVIENFPEGETEYVDAVNNPEDPAAGTRKIPFSRELYIEREDYMQDPPKRFHRLAPGREVRLRYACLLTCRKPVKNEAGDVVELRCTWDPASRGGTSPDGRKVKGTIHWVSAPHAIPAEVRLYDRLFNVENPASDKDTDFKRHLNPDSLRVCTAHAEPALQDATPGERFQFERLGYFCVDTRDPHVFNRTVPLRDSWTKQQHTDA
jgi:glutaminyl-tRNA synthetase